MVEHSCICLRATTAGLSFCADLNCTWSLFLKASLLHLMQSLTVLTNVGLVCDTFVLSFGVNQVKVNISCNDLCRFVQIKLMEGVPVYVTPSEFQTQIKTFQVCNGWNPPKWTWEHLVYVATVYVHNPRLGPQLPLCLHTGAHKQHKSQCSQTLTEGRIAWDSSITGNIKVTDLM